MQQQVVVDPRIQVKGFVREAICRYDKAAEHFINASDVPVLAVFAFHEHETRVVCILYETKCCPVYFAVDSLARFDNRINCVIAKPDPNRL